MTAASPQQRHAAVLHAQKMQRVVRNAQGNYDNAPDHWGVVAAIHPYVAEQAGPPVIPATPPSLDLYMDGTQNNEPYPFSAHTIANSPWLTCDVAYLASYTPTVGDTVLVRRGMRMSASDRTVLGKAAGATSPFPLPLGHLDSLGHWIQTVQSIWGGPGAPTIPQADPSADPPVPGAIDGDWYFQTDVPVTWQMDGGVWLLNLGLAFSTTQSGTSYLLAPSDAQTTIQFTNATVCHVTVPPGFPIGTAIALTRLGGPVDVSPGHVGMTFQSPGGLAIASQYGTMILQQNALNVWTLSGDVSPALPTTTQTSTYEVTPDDIGTIIDVNSSSAVLITITSGYSVPIGAWVELCQLGTGSVTVYPNGVTLLSPTGTYAIAAQYGTIRVRQSSLNVWVLSGDL